MIRRVSVKTGKAEPVIPVEGESLTGVYEFTILNTHATKSVELVESTGAAFGSGFLLPPGSAWSGQVNATYKLWVIAADATAVSVAVIGVPAA